MKSFFTLLILFIFLNHASAYFTTGESGELPKPGTYRIGIEPQFVLSNGSGTNVSAFIDVLATESASIRGRLGFGTTDFYTSFSYKWIPIPDYGTQPALGGKAEFVYARDGQDSSTAIRVHPMISKKYELNYGLVTPYGALPLAITNSRTGTDTAAQLVFGAEISPKQLSTWVFGGELGLSLNKSFNYISGSVTYLLEDTKKSR